MNHRGCLARRLGSGEGAGGGQAVELPREPIIGWPAFSSAGGIRTWRDGDFSGDGGIPRAARRRGGFSNFSIINCAESLPGGQICRVKIGKGEYQ
jgi:hypothetical protein